MSNKVETCEECGAKVRRSYLGFRNYGTGELHVCGKDAAQAVHRIRADAARWRAVTQNGFLFVDEDGGLSLDVNLTNDWLSARYLTEHEIAVLGGATEEEPLLRATEALNRAIDETYPDASEGATLAQLSVDADIKAVTGYLLEHCTGQHDCPAPHAAMDRIIAELRALRRMHYTQSEVPADA